MKTSLDTRAAYLLTYPCTFLLGLTSAVVGVLLIAVPGLAASTTIGSTIPTTYDQTWNVLLLVAGALVVYGMLTLRDAIEALGVIGLATTFIVDAVTLYAARGEGAVITGTYFAALGVGFGVRAYVVLRVRGVRIRWAKPPR